MIKICHLTSVHQRYDPRIFLKECKSLAANGFNVQLIVADGEKNELKDGIQIIDIGKFKNRKQRFLNSSKKILQYAIELDAEIYHFHDPELIPAGLKLKKIGKKVIYDVHEDIPRQILGKHYLNNIIKPLVSKFFERYENFSAKKFDYILTATPFIKKRFLKINPKTENINNYPIINELYKEKKSKKENYVCYLGGITKERGIFEMVKAISYINNGKFILAGKYFDNNLQSQLKQLKGWDNVIEKGFVNREEASDILFKSKAGLVTLHPTKSYIEALAVKMFEYMSAAIPVIASDFPLWEKIIHGNNCGICVNPLDPEEIANAIKYIFNNPVEAKQMGENGRKAVEEKYNWENEEKILLYIYAQLLNK